MVDQRYRSVSLLRIFLGFVAGFLATLVFHQLMLALLWGAGVAPSPPFSMVPTRPFYVPAVISLAFWGGIWGIFFAFLHERFSRGLGYWVTAFLFGAVLPSLVALLVAFPLKGLPVGGGWQFPLLLTVFLVNGAWGVGSGVFLKAFQAWSEASTSEASTCRLEGFGGV
ncbi:MAG: hypothetical protein AB1512_08580 [Thermodesulfobacteriota bacterium]